MIFLSIQILSQLYLKSIQSLFKVTITHVLNDVSIALKYKNTNFIHDNPKIKKASFKFKKSLKKS